VKNRTLARLSVMGGLWLVFMACTPLAAPPVAPPPTTYNRIIVDTYRFNDLASTDPDTFVSLYGSQGTIAAPIAEADGGNLTYTVGLSRIDYAGGLTSGTYYIRVKGGTSLVDGPYAFRVLTALSAPPNEYSASDYFAGVADPDPYEPDDAESGGIPTAPLSVSVGTPYNRYLTTGGGDVDWFKLVLP
jgi:hypothetical protein